MSSIQLFRHPDFGSLTTFKDAEGKEYYKAHDVCLALRLSNPSQQVKRYVKSKWVFEFDDGYSKSGKALYLSEPGFNALIFRSKTPQAEAFQDWVFEEVLPKLRASSGYIMPTATSEQVEALKAERNQITHERDRAEFSAALNASNYQNVSIEYDVKNSIVSKVKTVIELKQYQGRKLKTDSEVINQIHLICQNPYMD